VLSNNHVLDKSDQGTPGEAVSQPGLADTNCGTKPNTIVANLTEAAPLKTSNVDAAIAQIVPGEVDSSGAILDLQAADQPAPPSTTMAAQSMGLPVAKSGDATGLTCSTINAIALSVRVDYTTECQGGTKFSVLFTNQIAISGGGFSNSGDSGSLVVTSDKAQPVGLLYAGNSDGTVANPISAVLGALRDKAGNSPQIVGGPDHPVACPASPQSEAAVSRKEIGRAQLSSSQLARALRVEDRHAVELMKDPAVMNVGVGQSDDAPSESAITVFLRNEPRLPIPVQIDGIRTKLVRNFELAPPPGASVQKLSAFGTITDAEILRAKAVKERHAETMMSDPAILGVGVGASQDDPEEAAIVVFLERGMQVAVPVEIEGVRTQVVETDRFRTFNWGKRTRNSCSSR
jgi:hypothetical protein